VGADVWSVTSFNELYRSGQEAARWNMMHPGSPPRRAHAAECLDGRKGPAVAATDYIALYAEQIRGFMERPYRVLGTDGYGRSDTREDLRRCFEVDRYYVTLAALEALAALPGCPHPGPAMIAAHDDAPQVRAAAAALLGSDALPSSLPALKLLAEDPELRVRAAAARALDRLAPDRLALNRSAPDRPALDRRD